MNDSGDGITRKDFLNGMAWTAGAALASSCPFAARARAGAPGIAGMMGDKGADASAREVLLERGITESDPRYYPPGLSGMRGSHAGAFEAAHGLRDGANWDRSGAARDSGEHYDLVVVGAGISGLAAAHYYRKRFGPDARILILDNHDDFGGHAKRNEFDVAGRRLIGYGGTQSIEATGLWGPVARGLLDELGIDLRKFYEFYDQEHRKRWGLGASCFFDRETFGTDRLVPGEVGTFGALEGMTAENLKRFLDGTPLPERARADLARILIDPADPLPGRTKAEKQAIVDRTSCRAFLETYCKLDPAAIAYLNGRVYGLRAVGLEAIDANLGLRLSVPALMKAMGLHHEFAGEPEPYIFHFPDGNASIARMLVRRLVPGSASGSTMEDIVTARMDYAVLDRAENAVRIRLNSTVVRARNLGPAGRTWKGRGGAAGARGAELTYVRDGDAVRVRADHAVLACWNMIVPYLCPEMPARQKEGLAYNVKVPLVYGTVALRDWKALQALKTGAIYAPSGFWSGVYMDFPVSMGDYAYSRSPEEPVVLHMVRTPCSPGLPMKDQYRAGRAELFGMPFETFEAETRGQLDRMLGAGGFDSARDIAAITINRWPHGYSYMASPLWDPAWKEGEQPYVIGRQPFGRIVIANADAGGLAESFVSIDQAHRAVEEIAAMRGAAA